MNIYTQDSIFYKELNRLLRLRNRDALKPFFPYLRLFLTSLFRLTPIDATMFCGVKLNLSGKYAEGDAIVWWAFSSATATAGVLNNDEFLGSSGPRTLFSIMVCCAINICKYSAIGAEDERLILPGTPFTVHSRLNPSLGGGLTMIQIVEDRSCPAMISGFSFSSGSSPPQLGCPFSIGLELFCLHVLARGTWPGHHAGLHHVQNTKSVSSRDTGDATIRPIRGGSKGRERGTVEAGKEGRGRGGKCEGC